MDKKIIAALAVILVAAVGGFILLNQPGPPQVATLQGRVTDASGKAVAGATVSAGGKTAQTGADGSWLFTVAKGTYDVKVTKDGYEAKSSTVAATEAKSYTVDVSLTAIPVTPKKAILQGKVTDQAGNPLTASVAVGGKTITAGADGTWSLTVDVGSYTVQVSKDGYVTGSQTVSATEEKTYTVSTTLTAVAPPKPKEIVLKVLTRHDSMITMNAKQAFLATDVAKRLNIVDIKWYGVGATLWPDAVKRGGDYDIGWGGGPVLFDTLLNQNLLSPLKGQEMQAVLAQIPDEISGSPIKRVRNGEIMWCGAAISSFGFTVNKQKLAELKWPAPTKWIDFASPTYASYLPSSYLGTADAYASTSNTRMFEIILQTYGWQKGWEILVEMGANSKIYDQSGKVQDAAIVGEIAAGTTIDYYGYTAQLQANSVCSYVLPADGTTVNGDPIALLSTSPNPEAALAFITWELSAEGQKVWLNENINRLPANPAVFDTPEGKLRGDLKANYEDTKKAIVTPFSDDLAISYEASLMNYYHDVIARPQQKLTSVWMKMTDALATGRITQAQFQTLCGMLTDPTTLQVTDPDTGAKQAFTEQYAVSINNKIQNDPNYKAKVEAELVNAATQRYDAVAAELAKLTG